MNICISLETSLKVLQILIQGTTRIFGDVRSLKNESISGQNTLYFFGVLAQLRFLLAIHLQGVSLVR